MKKLLAMVSAAACLLFATLGLAGCDSGKYSETFPGVLSEETYETADAAAAAFLENEIAASDTRTTFVSYEKTKDITDEELASFDLGDVAAEDIGTKEWGTVTYEAALTSDGATALAAGGETMRVKVGMFQIGGAYRYFVPVAGTGEMISKSYYESVFDPAKYKNCTETFKMTVNSTASVMGQKATVKIDTKCTMKITEEAAEMKMTVGGSVSQGAAIPDTDLTIYIFKNGEGVAAYVGINGTWQQYGQLGVSSWDELYEMNLDKFIDYSYFEKTKTGFKISPMKYEKYMQQYVNGLNLDYEFSPSMDYSGEATYFVTEGRLSKATTKVSLKMSVNSYGYTATSKASASAVNTFGDFGTTTVQIPADLQALLG